MILEVEGLHVELGGIEALRNVSFAVERGACLGIVGESGSGKSLTCRTLVGLEGRIGARVARGRVVMGGVNLVGADGAEWQRVRGRQIALVPQTSLGSMDPLMRVGRQLAETVRALDPAADPWARALELLEQVEMPHARAVLDSYPHELSGGMRQRVMIALAIAGRPSLLIADEPTTALDVTVQRRILRLLTALRKESGMSMVFVSHNLNVVRSVSDFVTIMYAGTTVETGRVEEVLARPAHPYTRALLAAQPDGTDRAAPLASIPGAAPRPGHMPHGCPYQPRCPSRAEACAVESKAIVIDDLHETSCVRAGEVM